MAKKKKSSRDGYRTGSVPVVPVVSLHVLSRAASQVEERHATDLVGDAEAASVISGNDVVMHVR